MKSRAAFATEAAMGVRLGVSQPTIWRWINQSKQMPPEYVLAAEAATGVSRHDLRPDIYPRGESEDYMVHRPAEDEFVGVDLRARSRADRSAIADRLAAADRAA